LLLATNFQFSLPLLLDSFPFGRSFHLLIIVVTVKPIAVHITTREKFVSAEKRYDVECKSSGSRPEAVLTWWKGSRQIKRMAKNVRITLF
jgi:CD80-like C2-set immunoglobulin domain